MNLEQLQKIAEEVLPPNNGYAMSAFTVGNHEADDGHLEVRVKVTSSVAVLLSKNMKNDDSFRVEIEILRDIVINALTKERDRYVVARARLEHGIDQLPKE